ncbi:MAG: UDP-N-acetylmuramate dehydrogenase [Patescibacteria group bacterium]
MSIELKIKQNISLAPLTTFKIGGPAKFFIEVKTKEDLVSAFEWAKNEKQKVYIIGGASNILINDQGVNGLVIKFTNENITVRSERLDCGAGASLARALRQTVNNNLSGLEWSVGIPSATIGGSVRGNAGAFGTSISESVETVEVYNIKKKKFEIFSKKDCHFSYRESIFKTSDNYLIWNVILKLIRKEAREINKLVGQALKFRSRKQPKLPSAGSVFKNIKIENLRIDNPNLANLAENENRVKNGMVGVGWIIELAGLAGKTIGGAKVSLEHANFIINTSKASSEDVVILISYIKQQVRNRFKIQLSEEVQCLGF